MKCIRCNSEVAEGTKFCPYCGNPMIFQQQPHRGQYQAQQGQYQQSYQGQYQPQQGQYQAQQGQYQQPYQGQYQQGQGQYQQLQKDQSQKSNMGPILKVVEYIFYLLGVLDFCLGRFFDIDITGFWWSPLLFTLVGAMIGQYVKKKYGITDDD